MYGLEVRDYLVYIFREIMNGNKDYRAVSYTHLTLPTKLEV